MLLLWQVDPIVVILLQGFELRWYHSVGCFLPETGRLFLCVHALMSGKVLSWVETASILVLCWRAALECVVTWMSLERRPQNSMVPEAFVLLRFFAYRAVSSLCSVPFALVGQTILGDAMMYVMFVYSMAMVGQGGLLEVRKQALNKQKHKLVATEKSVPVGEFEETFVVRIGEREEFDWKRALDIYDKYGLVAIEGHRWGEDGLDELRKHVMRRYADRSERSGPLRGTSDSFRRRMFGSLTREEWKRYGFGEFVRTIRPFLVNVVGIQGFLKDFSFICSSYGSTNQAFHRDKGFDSTEQSITSFLALQDITSRMGPFEFFPGSHLSMDYDLWRYWNNIVVAVDNWRFFVSSYLWSTHVTLGEVATLLLVPKNRIDLSIVEWVGTLMSVIAVTVVDTLLWMRWPRHPGQIVQATVKKGSFILYSNKLIHRGSRNLSSVERVAVAMGFQSQSSWVSVFANTYDAAVFALHPSVGKITVGEDDNNN